MIKKTKFLPAKRVRNLTLLVPRIGKPRCPEENSIVEREKNLKQMLAERKK